MEKYSVLMSLYIKENPEYLKQSLDSMINQTIKPDQIVMVYDGPLTVELYNVMNDYIKKYPDLFHIVENEKNMGLGISLNRGLMECRNNLVARMDTDDISKPQRCEIQLDAFEKNPNLTLVGSHIEEFVENTNNVVSCRKVPISHEDIYNFAKRRSAFNHPTVMYKRNIILSFGGYSNLKRNQDVDLFGRLLYSGYEAQNIDESLLWFRTSIALSKRRKSWENTWSYIVTIKNFWKIGYASLFDFFIVLMGQIVMFVSPAKIQIVLYKIFLRR